MQISRSAKTFLTFLMCFIFGQTLYADEAQPAYKAVTLEGTQERVLRSDIVNQNYKIQIHLPRNYDRTGSNKTYPVVYLLDSQWDFPALVSMVGQLNFDGDIPDLIIVGLSWSGENADPGTLRIRDFSPTKIDSQPNSGGAAKFLKFIKTELIPFVNKEYRASDQRLLMGSSLGGLFTTYAMFNETNLFDTYITTATAAQWDDEVILKQAEGFVKNKGHDTKIKMYSAIGGNDSLMPYVERLHSYLEANKPSNLEIKHEIIPDLGHSAIKSVGYLKALQYALAKHEVALSEKQLQQYAGTYITKTGITETGETKDEEDNRDLTIRVNIEDGHLMVTNPWGSKDHFRAMSDTTFFLKGAYPTIIFDTQAQPTTLQVVLFDGGLSFVKTD